MDAQAQKSKKWRPLITWAIIGVLWVMFMLLLNSRTVFTEGRLYGLVRTTTHQVVFNDNPNYQLDIKLYQDVLTLEHYVTGFSVTLPDGQRWDIPPVHGQVMEPYFDEQRPWLLLLETSDPSDQTTFFINLQQLLFGDIMVLPQVPRELPPVIPPTPSDQNNI